MAIAPIYTIININPKKSNPKKIKKLAVKIYNKIKNNKLLIKLLDIKIRNKKKIKKKK